MAGPLWQGLTEGHGSNHPEHAGVALIKVQLRQ